MDIKTKNRIKIVAKVIFVVLFFVVWQILFSFKIWPEILFPSPAMIFNSFVKSFAEKDLLAMVAHSLILLIKGLLLGIVVAFIFSSLCVVSISINSIYDMIVSLFDLIPGIALIPVAILWLGVGDISIIFMVFHSVVWPLSRSIIDGFRTVPKIYIQVGENFGLKNIKLLFGIYFPSSFPRIFSGIRVGWARAWRGLISAEMVFGGGSALGIGYFITDRRTNLDIAGVFATIIVIILIGVVVEYGIFRTIENNTIRKWGMVA